MTDTYAAEFRLQDYLRLLIVYFFL
jgi:hypothetical protein